ncbi:membrane protein of unknown function [Methanoculleus bourgensis]|uniref:Permease n=1 Tax=Methanoculleus bourgensis TaxID=83986 RepID=A0A0X3BH74_9EURY|nr:membrane protein of unknown function [Methanoculleus bourgensis]
MDLPATLITAGQFFVVIAGELILLFVGITFLVGLLQAYIPEERIRSVLAGKRQGVGNVIGATFGALTPFCSCSTIPILLGLLEVGIPFGVCMSFLLASPLLNPIILSLLVALIGVVPTAVYAAVTFTAAARHRLAPRAARLRALRQGCDGRRKAGALRLCCGRKPRHPHPQRILLRSQPFPAGAPLSPPRCGHRRVHLRVHPRRPDCLPRRAG